MTVNPFLLTPKERLEDWRAMRRSLAALPLAEQLGQVARYFARAPLARFAHDPEKPDTWPGPWEMIHEGNWCKASVAIGMEFTLRLAGLDESRLRLRYVNDLDLSDLIHMLIVDNTHVLNHEHGRVTALTGARQQIIAEAAYRGHGYVRL